MDSIQKYVQINKQILNSFQSLKESKDYNSENLSDNVLKILTCSPGLAYYDLRFKDYWEKKEIGKDIEETKSLDDV